MGGSIGVIIRDHDGKVEGMKRWTNVMPYFFEQANLFSGNKKKEKSWLTSFLKEHKKMKKDYENNKDTGQFAFDMTDVYFPHDTLSPYSYGIIVVDFLKHKIYSSQNYCSINASFNLSYRGELEKNELNNLQNLFSSNILKGLCIKDKIIDIKKFTFDELLEFIDESEDRHVKQFSNPKIQEILRNDGIEKSEIRGDTFLSFNHKWKIYEDLANEPSSFFYIKEEMEKDGFVFSHQDNLEWSNHILTFFDENEKFSDEFKQQFETFLKLPCPEYNVVSL